MPEPPDWRYLAIHAGVVMANDDPRVQGRVRVCVAGLLPDGGVWAQPVPPSGGSVSRGVWRIPPVGASVHVFFLGGDPDRPRYMPGHWAILPDGASDAPDVVKAAVAEDGPGAAALVEVWETASFEFVIDERPDKRRAYLRSKARGEILDDGTALMIELDEEGGILTLSGTVAAAVRTAGLADVRGLRVVVAERPILPAKGKAI